MDVVIRERATAAEVERIPVSGEREANMVLSGVRINLGPDYRAAVEPSRVYCTDERHGTPCLADCPACLEECRAPEEETR